MGRGLDPWSGKIPPAMEWLSRRGPAASPALSSPRSATREATTVRSLSTPAGEWKKPVHSAEDPAQPEI